MKSSALTQYIRRNSRSYEFFFGIIFLVVVIDIITKKIAESVLPITKNYGAGFGILQHQQTFLIIVTVIACIGLFSAYKGSLAFFAKSRTKQYRFLSLPVRHPKTLASVSFAFIIGGALGNLYDRVIVGYVRDFITLGFWPSFNLADSFITLGTIGIIIIITLIDTKQQKQKVKKK